MIILNLQTKAHVSGIHVEFFEWFTSPHILEAKQRRKIYTKKLIWSQKLDTFIWWAFNSSGGDSKTPSISVVKRKKLSLEMWSVLFFGTAILKASIWVGGQGEIMYSCIPVWLMNSSHICYFIALHNTSLDIQRQGAPLPRGESDAGGVKYHAQVHTGEDSNPKTHITLSMSASLQKTLLFFTCATQNCGKGWFRILLRGSKTWLTGRISCNVLQHGRVTIAYNNLLHVV